MSFTSSNATMEQLLNAPALAPPPDVTPHMSTYTPEQAWFFVCVVFSSLIPGTLLVLRLYTKLRVIGRMELTDYMTIVAFLLFIVMLALGHFVLVGGGGAHQWNLTNAQLQEVIFWAWVDEIVYCPVITLIKAVILLQYIGIFAPSKGVDPLLYITSWVLIAAIAVWNIISVCLVIFACKPIYGYWNFLIPSTCIDYGLNILLTSVFNILCDLIILVLPSRAVWRLRLPIRKKLSIMSLFAIGVLACVANAGIIFFTLAQNGPTADISYNFAWLGLCAYAEISLGLIVICTLSLPKFIEAKGTKLRIFFSSINPFSTTSSSSFRTLGRGSTFKNSSAGRSTVGRSTLGGGGGRGGHDLETQTTIVDDRDRNIYVDRSIYIEDLDISRLNHPPAGGEKQHSNEYGSGGNYPLDTYQSNASYDHTTAGLHHSAHVQARGPLQ